MGSATGHGHGYGYGHGLSGDPFIKLELKFRQRHETKKHVRLIRYQMDG